ncbi:MAG TPA: helix-turn-helix transcriptional regulator [Bacteroidales bacterium]|nr:helix-turn-helix transcriptional regulator [Bacteroidales bacterium]
MKDRIQKIIEDKNLSPSNFADEVGLNRAVVSHILHGRNKPGLENLQRILSTYPDINPGWLISGIGSMYIDGKGDPKAPTLFDEDAEFPTNTPDKLEYTREIESKPVIDTPKQPVNQQVNVKIQASVKVKKIAVFYSDNTYEEFVPNNKD